MAGNPATSLSISAGERSEVTFRETPRSSASLLDEPLRRRLLSVCAGVVFLNVAFGGHS